MIARAPRLHHVAIRVRDGQRAVAFYRDLLGLPELRRRERDGVLESVWLEAGRGTIVMIERTLRGAGPEEGSGHLLALTVDDLDAWESRLGAAGYRVEDRTAHTIYTRDPDDHRVGLTVFSG